MLKKEPKIIMIHEMNDEILNKLSKSNREDIFTLDDGLYSNYKYLDELCTFPNKKIFFCSTDIIRPEIIRPNDEFIQCSKAHKLLSISDNSGLANYMSWNELKEIDQRDNCFIGVHGHKHIEIIGSSGIPKSLVYYGLEYFGTKKEIIEFLKEDTYQMYSKYFDNFKRLPNEFCFPYNKENFIYQAIIKQQYQLFKISVQKMDTNQTTLKIYGKGRINVNEL